MMAVVVVVVKPEVPRSQHITCRRPFRVWYGRDHLHTDTTERMFFANDGHKAVAFM